VATPEEDATESAKGVEETQWTCQATQVASSWTWVDEVESNLTDDSDSVDVDSFLYNKHPFKYPCVRKKPRLGSEAMLASALLVLGVFAAISDTGLKHHIHDGSTWHRRQARGKPTLKLVTRVCHEAYDNLSLRHSRTLGIGVWQQYLADTGASVCIAGVGYARALGIREDNLIPADMTIVSAEDSKIAVFGSALVTLTCNKSGMSIQQVTYICKGTSKALLSLEACVALGLVPRNFPLPGSAWQEPEEVAGAADVSEPEPEPQKVSLCMERLPQRCI
jgi:hypothetical protein